MARPQTVFVSFFLCIILSLVRGALCQSDYAKNLSLHYYKDTNCSNINNIVWNAFVPHFRANNKTAAQLLRLFFHDAFVNGVDGSILLRGVGESLVEMDTSDNQHLAGFAVIEDIKAQVEAICPNTVSCADVLTLAAKFSVVITGGPNIKLKLGRKDGNTSRAEDAIFFSPKASSNASGLIETFARVGLSPLDMITLSGAHTLGISHCVSVRDRLYPKIDKKFDPSFGKSVRDHCPVINNKTNPVTLTSKSELGFDPSPVVFDNAYYRGLIARRGLLTSDQAIYDSKLTRPYVNRFAKRKGIFFEHFAASMIRMSEINLRGDGNIRKICGVLN